MTKLRTSTGAQIVQVDSRYAFSWAGSPDLKIGERVHCEGRSQNSHFVGTVTGFGTEYEGPLKGVQERVDPIKPPYSPQGAERERIAIAYAEEYLQGVSIRKIAQHQGRSATFVRNLLREQHIQLRRRGGLNR